MESFAQLVPLAMKLPAFLMVVFRIGGIMIMAPFFGAVVIPPRVKIALTLMLAAALWPVLPQQMVLPSIAVVVVGVAGELLIGLLIGLAITTIFSGLQLAGTMIGQQMGVALAEVFNPAFEDQTDVIGVLLYWLGLLVFLAIGGHRLMVSGLLDSFKAVPLGGLSVGGDIVGMLSGMLSASFVMAFKMAIPAVLALFLVSVAMGLINRTVPQLNILTAGFALRTTVGMLVLAATLVAAMRVFGGTIEDAMLTLNRALSSWVA